MPVISWLRDYDHLFHRRFRSIPDFPFRLLDLGLPDLLGHPFRRAPGLVHLHPFAREYMHLLRAPHSQPDVRVSPVGCLHGPRDYAGSQVDPARPGVALPRPELRPPEHQDSAPDHRPPGGRGRDPGGFAQAEALPEEGHAPHSMAQSCGECAHGWRAGTGDSDGRVGHKRLPTTEIYAIVALAPGEGGL